MPPTNVFTPEMARGNLQDSLMRARLHDHIQSHPGISYGSLRAALMLGHQTADFHLQVLERTGHIRVLGKGKFRRFYPLKCAEYHNGLGMLDRLLLEIAARSPGITRQHLAQELGIGQRGLDIFIHSSIASGVLREEGVGESARYYPGRPKEPA